MSMEPLPGPEDLSQNILADRIALLQEARAGGALIHGLPPDLTSVLAEHGLYTTSEPRYPGAFGEFRRTKGVERALGNIASAVTDVMQQVPEPEYQDAIREGHLGSTLAGVFGAVIGISAEDVHVQNPTVIGGNIVDGTVIADRMTFVVASADHKRLLAGAFQALLRTPGKIHLVYPDTQQGSHTVEVTSLSEHTVRAIGRAVGALVEIEDRNKGVALPPVKRRYGRWKERGETFRPDLDQRLTLANLAYQFLKLRLSATYPGNPGMEPITSPDLLGTDAAPAFQAMRNIMNAIIRTFPQDSRRNLEQDPNEKTRLLIEAGVELRRNPVTADDEGHGPPAARTATSFEKSVNKGKKILEETKKHKIRAGIKLAGKAISAGAELLVDVALEYAPGITEAGKVYLGDAREWRSRKKEAVAAGSHIDRVLEGNEYILQTS